MCPANVWPPGGNICELSACSRRPRPALAASGVPLRSPRVGEMPKMMLCPVSTGDTRTSNSGEGRQSALPAPFDRNGQPPVQALAHTEITELEAVSMRCKRHSNFAPGDARFAQVFCIC
jgi:hypothetical protein